MIGVLADEGKGARLRTYLRAVTNIGLAVGTLGAAAVLAADTRPAYVAMILTDTITFLIACTILARLPHIAATRTTKKTTGGRGGRQIVISLCVTWGKPG